MCASNRQGRPDPGKFWENLRRPMPLGRKVRLLVANMWRRAVRLQDCCGHAGQPGC